MQTKKAINAVLQLLGVSGLSGITIAAPNALQAFDIFLRKNSKIKIFDNQKIFYELKRQGLVHVSQFSNETTFTLTPAGVYRLQRHIIEALKIPRPKKWNMRWRLITYDVPNKQSRQRACFTARLSSLGFYMLQRSVWVHPFPCFDQVQQIASHFNVLRYCVFLEVSKIDRHSEQRLLRRFEPLLPRR
ncbi:CRISPR-associated endonuclease Cas2 [Candidatus Saccharibacteria bacterium]|nr:CRISPR-associated endonuclease Cas2 [Candidatus Saccharibacteria bacterium]